TVANNPDIQTLVDVFAATPTPTPVPVIVRTPVPTPAPLPTTIDPQTPTPPPPLTTEEMLALEPVPERNLHQLAQRFKDPGVPIPVVVNPRPPAYQLGDREVFWVSNLDTDDNFQITAELRYLTPHLYMWVQEGQEVDQEALARSAERFEAQTYPTNRRFFGSEWSPGVDNDVHLHVLHASGLGSSVAGYFSGADEFSHLVNEFSNEKEMFYINLGGGMSPGSSFYDGVLAHEFQHMIHWYTDRNEDTWVNEGMSELAMQLNGYDLGGSDWLFSRQPDTQLNTWPKGPGAAGANYGGSYLLVAYFLDRFGEEATQALMAHPANGIAGFRAVLDELDTNLTFEDLFADWRVANYLDDPSLADRRYGYGDLDPVRPRSDEIHAVYPAQRATTVHQYGADYVELQGQGDLLIEFTGSTQVKLIPNEAHGGRYQWYSNRGDDSDMRLTRAFDLSGLTTATLQAWLWYDIEADWDYAYVAISDDGGETWHLLPGQHTTISNPQGNSLGHAYTGISGGGEDPEWVLEEIDLSAYAGREVLLRFEYITDDAVNRVGFCVDDVAIPELGYAHDAERGDDGWDGEGFVRTDNILPQRFIVQLIEMDDESRVRPMALDELQEGHLAVRGLGDELEGAMLIVSGYAPVTTELASYEYTITPLNADR
ncbi:MAG: immune inhibitor A, partial [Anaerolineae bacterium]